MVYSIHKGRRGRGVPCAAVVQYYCNSAGITGGGGQYNDDWLVNKSVEVNEYLVKAETSPHSETRERLKLRLSRMAVFASADTRHSPYPSPRWRRAG